MKNNVLYRNAKSRNKLRKNKQTKKKTYIYEDLNQVVLIGLKVHGVKLK